MSVRVVFSCGMVGGLLLKSIDLHISPWIEARKAGVSMDF